MGVREAQLTRLAQRVDEFLREQVRVAAIYLFGSQVTGRTHEYSDIDLAVFSPDADDLGLLGRMKLGAGLQEACGDDIEPHFFPEWALHDPPEGSFAEHVITTGKRIV
ncbi:MAG: nucleotidyltransferase domain-containing protein [Armatimonadota bacterium]|nr:nucleotidyltransferase domain-containing protein [Armatimonadota bacterium]